MEVALHHAGHQRLARQIVDDVVVSGLDRCGAHLRDAIAFDHDTGPGGEHLRPVEDAPVHEYRSTHR